MPRKRKKQTKAVFPMPEALAEGQWQITEGLPMVDIAGRHMSVPLEDTPQAAYARAHEMVHVKITPAVAPVEQCSKYGISMIAFQAVEDMRVHTFMKRREIPRAVVTRMDEIKKNLTVPDPALLSVKKLTSLLVSITNCDAQRKLFLEAIKDILPSEKAHAVINIAALTQQFFLDLENKITATTKKSPLETMDGFEALTIPTAKLFDSLFFENEDDEDEQMPVDRYRGVCREPHGEWGQLEPIRRPILTQPKKKRGSGQKIWREEGVTPSAIHRLTVDNRVFARKKRVNGGTVLIDASGSMHFSDEDLVEIIAAAPGATVGVYAGMAYSGRLVIAAKNGRMATVAAIQKELSCAEEDGGPMCGNVVDGPALRWLATQAGPRIWVSDGMVTGVHDAMGINLMAETAQILKAHDIDRITDWREVVEILR